LQSGVVETVVPALVSSGEGGVGTEEMEEEAMDLRTRSKMCLLGNRAWEMRVR
jgi:hypothetical protein